MRLANRSVFAAATFSSAFLLATLLNHAKAQTGAQQPPAYVAKQIPSSDVDTWTDTTWGVLSSCPDPSEDGPYAGVDTFSNPGGSFSGGAPWNFLIRQGGNWIPASATYSATFSGGVRAVYTSILNSSGTVTTTYTFTGTNSSSSSTETGVEFWQLGNGNDSTYTGHNEYSGITTDSVGCVDDYSGFQEITGSIALQFQPYTPEASLMLVDPENFGNILSLQSTVDPNSVPNAPAVGGLAADGVSAAAIFYNSFSSRPVTFTLTGAGMVTGAVPSGSIGTLTNFAGNYPLNPQPGSNTTVQLTAPLDSTQCNSSTDQAGTSQCTFLALLWSPGNMPYATSTPESINLTLTATQSDANGVQGTVSSNAILEPPPLVLVHGIWGDAFGTWGSPTTPNTFENWLSTNYPSVPLEAVDYSASNYLSFAAPQTQGALEISILSALSQAEEQGVIARSVDVVAHSMGGLVTRYFIDNISNAPYSGSYLPSKPVHQLITIGTPEQGSPLALALWNNVGTSLPPSVWQNDPELRQYCNSANPGGACSLGEVFNALGRPVTSNVQGVQSGVQSLIPGNQPTGDDSYYAVVGQAPVSLFGPPNPGSCTEWLLDQLIGDFIPGENDYSYLGPGSDTIVPQNSQSFGALSNEAVPVSGVVHVSLCGSLDTGETSRPAVWNQVAYWLMGGQGQAPAQSSNLAATRRIAPLEAGPLDNSASSLPPVINLTSYTQVPSSNVSFSPASGAVLTINSPTNIFAASSTKTITEVLLFQGVSDPTDVPVLYSAESPFAISFTPTRLGSTSFTALTVFSDNTYAATYLSYTFQPSGSPLTLNLVNVPAANLPVGSMAIVRTQALFSNGPFDVTPATAYTARSGEARVFTVGTNGSITATGNGVDWLDASYQGAVGSALISVGQCTYTITPTSQIVDYGGASTGVQVTTQNGCAWTASSDSAWLTFSQASGSGSAILSATAAANAGGSLRTANITVGNATGSVTQQATSCSFTPSPTAISLSSGGGSGNIYVTTSCPFSSSSNESWAIPTTLSQSSVAYYVTANNTQQSRTATLTIGKGQVTITQAAEAGEAGAATLTSATPGSTLGTSNVMFTWTKGTNATEYNLWLGLSGPGSSSLYTSGWLTTTSTTVTSVPAHAATVYARLYSQVNGVVEYNDYIYTETGTPAAMSTPAPGKTLGTSGVTFNWTAGYGVSQYQLWLGLSGPGSSSLYTSGWLTTTSTTVPSLPAKGATVYARLYSEIAGKIVYNDYTYAEAPAGAPATMISPAAGSTLGISNVKFTWTAGTGTKEYNLWLGLNGPGSSSLYTSGWLTTTSTTVTSVPAHAATVYARLYSQVNGVVEYNDYIYTETGTPAAMSTPAPGKTLGTSGVTFNWTAGYGVSQYQLWLGLSGPGSSSLYTSGWLTTTSTTVPSLPAKGATVYARLYSEIAGKIVYNDYTYAEAPAGAPATMISPAAGSTLGISNVKFTWTAGTGTKEYNLWLGLNGPGSSDLYASGWLTSTSATVASLPAKGATVYARLYSVVNGVTQYNEYTYAEQ